MFGANNNNKYTKLIASLKGIKWKEIKGGNSSRDLSRVRENVSERERERVRKQGEIGYLKNVKYVGCTFCKSVSVKGIIGYNFWLLHKTHTHTHRS